MCDVMSIQRCGPFKGVQNTHAIWEWIPPHGDKRRQTYQNANVDGMLHYVDPI